MGKAFIAPTQLTPTLLRNPKHSLSWPHLTVIACIYKTATMRLKTQP